MLNKNGERELAYVVRIDAIEPIVGSDNCEAAVVGGWKVMVRKNTFHSGDLAVYFEIDSHVDTSKPEFAFLEAKHGNVKTQKYTFGGKGNFVSQGLLMHPNDFGWEMELNEEVAGEPFCYNEDDSLRFPLGCFLTRYFEVTYATAEDNSRKEKPDDKYKKMAQRNGKLFAKQPFRWLMKRSWGRKLLFIFFGKKKDKRGWPQWVARTDEERVQNMPWILNDKSEWVATEKIDGTSTTFTMKRKRFGKNDFYVCSRNVVFDKPDKQCFYDTNVYLEMANKYNIEFVLSDFLMRNPNVQWVTLQGETFGPGIQKRDYHLPEHEFMGFNFITDVDGRWDSESARAQMAMYNIPWVPILDTHFILPDTVDELLQIATGESVCDHELREGMVFRSKDGARSFKAVSNEFLLKYHNG